MTQNQKSLSDSGFSPLKSILKPQVSDDIDLKSPITRYGAGFDVHKNHIDVCVSAQLVSGDIIEIRYHRFRANPKGIEEIVRFLRKYRPMACYLMECTGIYHLPLYHSLKLEFPESADKVIAMNPLLLNRRISELGKHTDKANARSLSTLTFYTSLLKPSYIGSMQFFRLRDMIRSYHKSQQNVTRFKNRITRVLHSLNIKDAFDLQKEWALLLLDRFASKEWSLEKAYTTLIEEREKAGISSGTFEKQRNILEPYFHITLSKEDRFVVQMEMSRMFHEQIIAVSFLKNAENYVIIDPLYIESYKKLSLIPGMGPLSAMTVILEIGDYNRFKNPDAFAKFCGTTPLIYDSGEFKAKGHLNKFSNKYIRTTLTTAAGVILNRCKRDSDLGEYAYRQYHIRNIPYKKVLIKVANKLAKTIYYILAGNVDFDPFYEHRKKHEAEQKRLLDKKHSLLPSKNTVMLRRNINEFIALNFEFLNSSSRFNLITGFKKMLKKAQDLNTQPGIESTRKK